MDIRKNVTPTVGLDVATIYAAIELSMKSWLVALQSVRQERPGRHQLAAHDAAGLWALIERERAALLAAGYARVRVVTCYEAAATGSGCTVSWWRTGRRARWWIPAASW